ncbi:hypothetical protein [Pseudonocardia pini]|nr:hypothetical protein [Pseudonocardia pini]
MLWNTYAEADGTVRAAVWHGAIDAAVAEGAPVRPLRKEDA